MTTFTATSVAEIDFHGRTHEFEVRFSYRVIPGRYATRLDPPEGPLVEIDAIEVAVNGKWHSANGPLHDLILNTTNTEHFDDWLIDEAREMAIEMALQAACDRANKKRKEAEQ